MLNAGYVAKAVVQYFEKWTLERKGKVVRFSTVTLEPQVGPHLVEDVLETVNSFCIAFNFNNLSFVTLAQHFTVYADFQV